MTERPTPIVDELHRRIGRNLLRFQAIELSLKLMLPYIHPNGGAKGADAMREYQSKNVTGKSLGLLLGEGLWAEDSEGDTDYVRTFPSGPRGRWTTVTYRGNEEPVGQLPDALRHRASVYSWP